ncbi:MAG: hypothetical protein GKS07_06110 [Nitrosopumilus sp.]|nr:MAG: hypothetical protein GKS07_06110 [Nitrosopumilus sp.]
MSVNLDANVSFPHQEQWRVVNDNPFHAIFANVDGAELRYIDTDTDILVIKKFIKDSYVLHVPGTTTMNYMSDDVIPFVEGIVKAAAAAA